MDIIVIFLYMYSMYKNVFRNFVNRFVIIELNKNNMFVIYR